ncbi:MAG: T9SS type A sorting domain-containing protein, partial [Candidatus Cloacimonetes bacterium]|nr:T9SS type A sorting domain-containing protein [Candidatus Cloacimonadota bacterium]
TSSGNNDIPLYTALSGNYPNPFNPSTAIRFSLSEAAHTRLIIYNLKGETVKVLHDGELPAAHHQIIWDGRDAAGRAVASGVYLYQLNSGSYNDTRKMILMK